MNATLNIIPTGHLILAFTPLLIVALVMWRWSAGSRTLAFASMRMILQLVVIGYLLTFIFAVEQPALIALVLAVMLLAASWIALRPLGAPDSKQFGLAVLALGAGSLFTLAVVIIAVLRPQPWFEPRIIIPIAGMIFSSAMNTVSLTAERYAKELAHGADHADARREALSAGMIPVINAFFAVGLVTLPGMMTGQILSGVDPSVAVRYQIVVMCMTCGAGGLSAITYLQLVERAR
ncbi:MAG: ABC transporter permease [Chromatiales bacterium]|jgi:putative ABC transport system permease protein|nr:ABC transporter permease [Chromatiales bacterium]